MMNFHLMMGLLKKRFLNKFQNFSVNFDYYLLEFVIKNLENLKYLKTKIRLMESIKTLKVDLNDFRSFVALVVMDPNELVALNKQDENDVINLKKYLCR